METKRTSSENPTGIELISAYRLVRFIPSIGKDQNNHALCIITVTGTTEGMALINIVPTRSGEPERLNRLLNNLLQ